MYLVYQYQVYQVYQKDQDQNSDATYISDVVFIIYVILTFFGLMSEIVSPLTSIKTLRLCGTCRALGVFFLKVKPCCKIFMRLSLHRAVTFFQALRDSLQVLEVSV